MARDGREGWAAVFDAGFGDIRLNSQSDRPYRKVGLALVSAAFHQ